MHQQSPINASRQIIKPCSDVRLCLWNSWGGSLLGILILLLLFSDGMPLPAAIALPLPIVVHLILMSTPLLLLLLSRRTLLITCGARDRSLLTFAMTAAGIELDATLITVILRDAFDIVTDLPMPELDFLFAHRHSLIYGATLLVLLYAFLHGLVLPGDQPAAGMASRPAILLQLYFIPRLLFGLALGLPLKQPALAWLVAAALPIGLGLGLLTACLVNRFWSQPESLPHAPQP